MTGGGTARGASAVGDPAIGAAGNSTTATGRPMDANGRQGTGGVAVGGASSTADSGHLAVDAPGRGDGSAQDQAARAATPGDVTARGDLDATDDGPSPIAGGIAKGTDDAENRR